MERRSIAIYFTRAVISMVYYGLVVSGATLGLVLAMIVFGQSKYSKALSRTCIVPGIFNINEPVIFGLPIVLNPILIIPFIITPLVTATVAYSATAMGL
ncbi:PTS transporter subunit EIIC [Bacillus pacificus]